MSMVWCRLPMQILVALRHASSSPPRLVRIPSGCGRTALSCDEPAVCIRSACFARSRLLHTGRNREYRRRCSPTRFASLLHLVLSIIADSFFHASGMEAAKRAEISSEHEIECRQYVAMRELKEMGLDGKHQIGSVQQVEHCMSG